MRIEHLHHANINIPPGKEARARKFYCDLLGLVEITKPDALRLKGGFWLRLDNLDLHIGVQDGIDRNRFKMHLAFEVDDLHDWRQRVKNAGISIHENTPIPDFERFEIRDPFGNRLEFVQVRHISDPPFLTRPDARFRDSFIEAMREFEGEGDRPPWNYNMLETAFEEYVETILKHKTDPMPGFVPQTTYWLIAEGQYAGTIDVRHHLTSALRRFGGHIGYRIRPSMRRRGYGTLQLKLVLPYVWALGIERCLITCDDDNIGSQKIIEANGGVLQDKIDNKRQALTRRYWIDRPAPQSS